MNNQGLASRVRSNDRRGFLRKMGGVVGLTAIGAAGLPRNATATSEWIRGRVQRADNSPATTNRILAWSQEILKNVMTQHGGQFEFNPEGSTRLLLGYYETVGDTLSHSHVKDGSPDMYTLPLLEPEDSRINLGNIKLPDAHLLNVNVVDGDDNPATNVRISVIHIREVGSGSIWFGTGRPLANKNGQFQLSSSDNPGIELAGTVRARVWPIDFVYEDGPLMEETVEMTKDRTVTFTLQTA